MGAGGQKMAKPDVSREANSSHLVNLASHTLYHKVMVINYMQPGVRNINLLSVSPISGNFWIIAQSAWYIWLNGNFLLSEPNIALWYTNRLALMSWLRIYKQLSHKCNSLLFFALPIRSSLECLDQNYTYLSYSTGHRILCWAAEK